MGWVCPKHGKERIHKMRLNRYVDPWEFEVLVFSCGRFIAGTIKGKNYHDPDDFMTAFKQLLDEWKETRELYRFFSFRELESRIDRKLGLMEKRR